MKMPVLFVGHGSPMIALDENSLTKSFAEIAELIPHPRGILTVSAHWYVEGNRIQSAETPHQIYDMYGFPPELYEVKYRAAGSGELTQRVRELLTPDIAVDDSWGIDHGSWTVLVHMYPDASIPIVQLSVNRNWSPIKLFKLGEKLRTLRDEGWLLLGSGNVVHNLRRLDWSSEEGTMESKRFDALVKDCIINREFNPLFNYRELPDASYAVPTPDHLYPLFYVLGASGTDDDVHVFNEVQLMGSISMTSYLFLPNSSDP